MKDPMNVSTIFPSMRSLARSLIEHSGMQAEHHVLELGCGSGAVTRYILKHRNELQSYTGVEVDKSLADFLKAQYPREQFLNLSAHNLKEFIEDGSIDSVISTLPWTLFKKKLQENILQEIIRVLKPGGKFTTFLCLHALAYPGASRAKKLFHQYFSEFRKMETITRNIPPANVYMGLK